MTKNESNSALPNGSRPRPDAQHCGSARPPQGDPLGVVGGGREAGSAAGDRLGNCRPAAGVVADRRFALSANGPRRLLPELSVPGMKIREFKRIHVTVSAAMSKMDCLSHTLAARRGILATYTVQALFDILPLECR